MKAEEILNLIDENKKPVRAEWLSVRLDIEKSDAKQILDQGFIAGLLNCVGEEYHTHDLVEHYNEKQFEKRLKPFRDFIDKFFSDVKIQEEYIERAIKLFTDKRHLAKQFLKIQPLYYDKNKLWWIWDTNATKYKIIDETSVLNLIFKHSSADTINAKARIEILEALKQEGRKNKPKEIKESWVQFKDKIIDIETDEEFRATPKYFVTNPIKWRLGKNKKTPKIDKLFESWVGKEHVQELYEILAFCLIPIYFIHRIICLIGSGANGKGTYLKLIKKFIGENNMVSTSLDLLITSRFASGKLYKQLVCLMGETTFATIRRTEFIKGATGEDTIPAEIKGGKLFDFVNYAKFVIATNSLPMTLDKTEGFYRRWKIIKFLNKFLKEKDVLSSIPDQEYENLARKCLTIAKKLWKDRIFSNDGDFQERKQRYEEESNPLMLYFKKNYKRDINGEVKFSEFYEGLSDFLNEYGYRLLTAVTVSKQLKAEGFDIKKKSERIDGVPRSYQCMYGMSGIPHVSTQPLHGKAGKKIGNTGNTRNTPKKTLKDFEKKEKESQNRK